MDVGKQDRKSPLRLWGLEHLTGLLKARQLDGEEGTELGLHLRCWNTSAHPSLEEGRY